MADPARYFTNNVDGTVRLLEAVRSADVGRMVFSSSCSVYGTPATVPVDETADLHPESVYAETKFMVERILGWYDVVHGFRSCCLRYFNAAGASADGKIGEDWSLSQNLIPVAMKAALTGSPTLRVFGTDYPTPDGTCVRDYIHVDDLADAHVRALANLVEGGPTTSLNVGTGKGSSVLDVIAAIERTSGRQVPHELVDRRAGDPSATYADPRRIREVLGWSARHDLDDIVESAYRWHASQVAGTH
jgi:UDP-glucose-4-epimerase GalE